MNRRVLLFAAAIVCWAGVIGPASAQEFKAVTGTLTEVAAGRNEVWGLDGNHNVYRFSTTGQKFNKLGTVLLTQISVGGGSLMQNDEIWGVNTAGHIFQFNYTTGKLTQIPGGLVTVVVGEGDTDSCHPYEVWGINSAQSVFRYNYCTLQFVNVAGLLTHIATGGGDVWGLNGSADIFKFNFKTLAWTEIAGTLQQITVGANDVYGLDGAGKVYRYEGASGFVLIDGTNVFTQVVAGGNGAWGINTNAANIVRFDPNVEGEIGVPGILSQIAVGYGAGVWGVNSAESVFSFVRP